MQVSSYNHRGQLDLRRVEENLAKELQRKKIENESRMKMRQKIIEESDEIKQIKEKIQQAYVNKERCAQIAEKQVRRLQDLVKTSNIKETSKIQNDLLCFCRNVQLIFEKFRERRLKLKNFFCRRRSRKENALKGRSKRGKPRWSSRSTSCRAK